MRTRMFLSIAVLVLGMAAVSPAAEPEWSMNGTIIEACSCPMFCQCYFDTKPAGHAKSAPGSDAHAGHAHGAAGADIEHFCRFNMAHRINSGHYGDTKLDGAKFWIAGDLGGDFSHGQTEWSVITFDPGVSQEQRDAILKIVPRLYEVTWKSQAVGKDAPIEWTAGKDKAVANLDGGKAGEIVLRRNPGMTDEPVVIKNLRYFAVPRNDGFVLMPSEIEAYRLGDKAFEFKGSNGFMITYDINSKDVATRASEATK